MRLERGIRTLTAAAVAVSLSSASASARFFTVNNEPVPVPAAQHATAAARAPHVTERETGSADWTAIALGTAGGVALIGGGAVGWRRRGQRGLAAEPVRAARGS
jgi:hypothetical protein